MSIDTFVSHLLDKISSTSELQLISDTLEDLTQKPAFRDQAHDIATDKTLNGKQKVTQLLYLIRSTEVPLLYDFFIQELTEDQLWLFTKGKIDYFDEFVQKFQLATEEIGVVYLTTAIPLDKNDLQAISDNLEKSFGYRVLINHQVNATILGGAQVRVENLIFDYSLRTKFSQFEQQWLSSLTKTQNLIGLNEPD